MTTDLDALARELRDAQDRGRSIAPFSAGGADFELAGGRAVAARVPAARLAMAPCAFGRFAEPKIEPEIAWGMRGTPRDARPQALLEAIERVAHGFEIVQSHFPGWRFAAHDTAADQGLHARLLPGPPQLPTTFGADPETAAPDFEVGPCCNGEPRDRGCGANAPGSPPAALGHPVEVLPEPLRGGGIVTTGALTPAFHVQAGETWHTELDGIDLPGVERRFVG